MATKNKLSVYLVKEGITSVNDKLYQNQNDIHGSCAAMRKTHGRS